MTTQYRTIEVHTVAGHDEAERLLRAGWELVRGGMFTVVLKRRAKSAGSAR